MDVVFDIGGSKLRVASSRDGETLSEPIIFSTPRQPELGLKKLITAAKDLAGDETITSLTGGIAGVLNAERTQLIRAANLSSWEKVDLATPLEHELHCPIRIENDASIGGLGEATRGAGRNYQRVVYITIGTGLGGAWIVDGRLPSQGNTEPGHQILDWQTGSDWEQLADNSATAKEQVHFLAVGLFNTLLLWPADIVVLGGGKTFHKGWTAVDVKKQLALITGNYIELPDIKVAELGDLAGLHGALYLAQQ